MPRAYSYLRFSTPEQMQGDSFRRQSALAQTYAHKHGLDLDTSLNFHDLGVSAFHGKNFGAEGQLGNFIQAVKSRLVSQGSYPVHRAGGRPGTEPGGATENATHSRFAHRVRNTVALLFVGWQRCTRTEFSIYSSEGASDKSEGAFPRGGASLPQFAVKAPHSQAFQRACSALPQ